MIAKLKDEKPPAAPKASAAPKPKTAEGHRPAVAGSRHRGERHRALRARRPGDARRWRKADSGPDSPANAGATAADQSKCTTRRATWTRPAPSRRPSRARSSRRTRPSPTASSSILGANYTTVVPVTTVEQPWPSRRHPTPAPSVSQTAAAGHGGIVRQPLHLLVRPRDGRAFHPDEGVAGRSGTPAADHVRRRPGTRVRAHRTLGGDVRQLGVQDGELPAR